MSKVINQLNNYYFKHNIDSEAITNVGNLSRISAASNNKYKNQDKKLNGRTKEKKSNYSNHANNDDMKAE